MDTRKHLIFVKGVNRTSDIESCKYDQQAGQYYVKFSDGRSYTYGNASIIWLTNPEQIDPALYQISRNGKMLSNIQSISVFKGNEEYWHIVYSNGYDRAYLQRELTVEDSCTNEPSTKNRLDYLRELASIHEIQTDDGKVLLEKYYKGLDFVSRDSALAAYLNPELHPVRKYNCDTLIFPFGGNASQFKAVENALTNQISVIQGPPGTGKTQTILNIIANLLIRNKTVQVVSSNNSATENVQEKLGSSKYMLDFLVASLGKRDNKAKFINKQTGEYPDLSMYRKDMAELQEMGKKIAVCSQELSSCFSMQERLARAKQELTALELEICYFKQHLNDVGVEEFDKKLKRRISSTSILRILQECETFAEKGRNISIWHKIRNTIFHSIFEWDFYNNDVSVIVTNLQTLFYRTKQSELKEEIAELERVLANVDAKGKMDEITNWSLDYLRAVLYERFGKKRSRTYFNEDSLWKNPESILREYPIVLSSTFSSRSTLKNVTYDYVIMDEASQVDIATGALALSCAKNAVIVGDVKQLSNIVRKEQRNRSDAIFKKYELPAGYSFSEYSFLKSVCTMVSDAPQTLLREHYRCHPKIIGFCNQKFYNNELVIMTEDNDEPNTITVYRTSAGNHKRGHINQRQIDTVKQEILPKLENSAITDIGIIAPYRDQKTALATTIAKETIKVETIHKFQGQENDTIILTMVDDVVTDFTDKPDLLNVAISRAKKQFYLVVSGNEQPADSNIADLISYIKYNNFEVINSEVYSIFDLLYQQYTEERLAFLAKHKRISRYDSENLMYGHLVDILRELPDMSLSVICHQKLRLLIRNFDRLTEEEGRYVSNPNTHVDFLIYNRITKKPVLAIEVDGFNFHKKGTPQSERDRLKDSILEKYSIPLLRLPTNGSGEIEKVKNILLSS